MTVGFTNIYFFILPIHMHISQGLLDSFSFINLITIIVPGSYTLFILIKKGLKISEISVSKENKNTNLKKLNITCLFGGIFFGVFMNISTLNHTNIKIAVIEGILGGAFFGISFYIIERLLIKKSEKILF